MTFTQSQLRVISNVYDRLVENKKCELINTVLSANFASGQNLSEEESQRLNNYERQRTINAMFRRACAIFFMGKAYDGVEVFDDLENYLVRLFDEQPTLFFK